MIRMKVIIFQGGLGNQIFQYAFYKKITELEKEVYYIYRKGKYSHNGLELNKYFDVSLQIAPWYIRMLFLLCDILKQKGILNLFTNENSKLFPKGLFLDGYWQDKRYFYQGFIRLKKLCLNNKNRDILFQIKEVQSVSIHIRRGDYLLPHFKLIYGGVCSESYYNKAINICLDKFKDCRFFVFSDDILWVKEHLVLPNAVYIDWNKGDDSIYDLYLMTQTRCNIIANSTFSFWGAYLNESNLLTIYPSKWYNSTFEVPDIFPQNWIGI